MNKFVQIMNDKRGPVIVFIIAFIGVIVGYVMSHMSKLGLCLHPFYYVNYSDCGNSELFHIGHPLYAVFLGLIATSAMFFFVHKKVFRSWLRWVSAIVVASFLLSLIREVYVFNIYTMAKDFSIVFFFLSLIFIFWQSSKKQR